MVQIAQLIGGAGTGKTTELLRLMAVNLDSYQDPRLIGFVSFTRAAREEAAKRAAEQFNVPQEELERSGWFRTIHSVCYRVLAAGKELLANDKASREWLEEALQQSVSGTGDGDYSEIVFDDSTDADIALRIWGTSRSRLEPLKATWHGAALSDDRVPGYPYIEAMVERYEQAKRLDGRVDFTDLLARVAGFRFTVEGADPCTPDGDLPDLPVWFFDEQQDTSALLDAVCHRLIGGAERVYVTGDPFQAIYTWAGADPKYFMAWPVTEGKRKVMPKSYRCPRPILALGERILKRCSDYWDRKIEPADHSGVIEEELDISNAIANLDPREEWLLLARTNYLARRFAGLLNDEGMPWLPTKGNNTWNAPARNAAIEALLDLETGNPIDGDKWRCVLGAIKVNMLGKVMLDRGTKAKFKDKSFNALGEYPFLLINHLKYVGATDDLIEAIRSGQWRSMIDNARQFTTAAKRWGIETVRKPKIRVGTIHSVKGAEADNVLLCNSIGRRTFDSMQTTDGLNSEQRCWYVAATRAKKRLVVAGDGSSKFEMELPL